VSETLWETSGATTDTIHPRDLVNIPSETGQNVTHRGILAGDAVTREASMTDTIHPRDLVDIPSVTGQNVTHRGILAGDAVTRKASTQHTILAGLVEKIHPPRKVGSTGMITHHAARREEVLLKTI
jgi:hypothetical protein